MSRLLLGGEMAKYLVSLKVDAQWEMTKEEVLTTVKSMLYEGREFSNNPHVMAVTFETVEVEELGGDWYTKKIEQVNDWYRQRGVK
jgi:hypothetical protein